MMMMMVMMRMMMRKMRMKRQRDRRRETDAADIPPNSTGAEDSEAGHTEFHGAVAEVFPMSQRGEAGYRKR
jgi:hypothetical protein